MSDYTPTTGEVRDMWSWMREDNSDLPMSEGVAEFDRWYATEKAKWIQRGREFEREINTPLFPLDEAAIRADEREKAARRVMDALIDSTGADTEAVWTIVCDSIPEERRGGIEQGVVLTITGAIASLAATAARGIDTTK